MTIDELRQFSDAFDEDIYDAVSMKTCVDKRLTTGAPGADAMKEEISLSKDYLNNTPALIHEKELK